KMEDVGKEGRTVLFVSHNMAALTGLCSRAVMLNQGIMSGDGAAVDIVRQYIGMGKEQLGEVTWPDCAKAPGNEKIRLHAVRIISNGSVTRDIEIDRELQVEIEFWNLQAGANVTSSIHLLDEMGVAVLASANMHSANLIRDEWFGRPHEIGLYKSVCTMPANFLNDGRYSINVIVLTNVSDPQVYEKEVLNFNVHETGEMRKEYRGDWIGVVRPKLPWFTELIQHGCGEGRK
ncbi:MAG TPA: hypothetical protein VIO11_07850, partial [Candidatus Methanoperedens sp.]